MSVLKIEPTPEGDRILPVLEIYYIDRGQQIAPKLEEYFENQKKAILQASVDLGASATSVQMGASAVLDKMEEVGHLLEQIAEDNSISKKAREDYSNFLACVSLQYKRALHGDFRPTTMTAARLHPGHLLSGGLRGVRVGR